MKTTGSLVPFLAPRSQFSFSLWLTGSDQTLLFGVDIPVSTFPQCCCQRLTLDPVTSSLKPSLLLCCLQDKSRWVKTFTICFLQLFTHSNVLPDIVRLLLPHWPAQHFLNAHFSLSAFAYPSLMGSGMTSASWMMIGINHKGWIVWVGGGVKMDVGCLGQVFSSGWRDPMNFRTGDWSLTSQKEGENQFTDLFSFCPVFYKGELVFWQVI